MYSSRQQHAIPDDVLQHCFSSYEGETNVTAALKHKTDLPQSFVMKTILKMVLRLNSAQVQHLSCLSPPCLPTLPKNNRLGVTLEDCCIQVLVK